MQSPLQLNLPNLPFLKSSFLLGLPMLIIIFVIFFILYVIVSAILMYHWSAYGMSHKGILMAESLYLIVSVVLFGVAGLALLFF